MPVSQEKNTVEGDAGPVRERLLDTAERLFSEHGFEGTSVRELASAAGCNIASVNYYFGSKEKLYEEIFRRHLIPMRNARIASIDRVMTESSGRPKLEDLLQSFANAFIEPLADETKAARFMKLMGREMVDSHLPSDVFAKEMAIPTLKAIQIALLKACPGLDESRAVLVAYSIIGQLLHAVHIRPMFEQACDAEVPKYELSRIIDHIVAFSAAAIRAYAEGRNE
ncbi:MAG: TetR/AcrR family transcriptional regulator [Sedimentisphaerales bacterium]|nr:TetR/AcrR family transcriptional regulator [Sedimentisphaerales bacterium]